jgi:chromosome segregation ATPase
MKANLNNTETNLVRHDKEIKKEEQEILKLEEANARLKADTEKNTELGEKLLSEMAAIEEEKKTNREALDSRRNTFNNLKRDLQRVEDEETKAKAAVEDALKQRNQLDEFCKQLKTRVKQNREKFRV